MNNIGLLSRFLQRNPPKGGAFSKSDALVYLLAQVKSESYVKELHGYRLSIESGWIAIGENELAKAWGWGVGRVRNFLQSLVEDEILRQEDPIVLSAPQGRVQNGIQKSSKNGIQNETQNVAQNGVQNGVRLTNCYSVRLLDFGCAEQSANQSAIRNEKQNTKRSTKLSSKQNTKQNTPLLEIKELQDPNSAEDAVSVTSEAPSIIETQKEKKKEKKGIKKEKRKEKDISSVTEVTAESSKEASVLEARAREGKSKNLNSRAREVFEAHFLSVYNEPYYWCAKDAGQMPKLMDRLRFQREQKMLPVDDDSLIYALEVFLKAIQSGWVYQHFDVSTIVSHWNKLITEARTNLQGNGYRQDYISVREQERLAREKRCADRIAELLAEDDERERQKGLSDEDESEQAGRDEYEPFGLRGW